MQYMQGEVLYTVQGSLSWAHTCCGNADEGTLLHLSGTSDADQRWQKSSQHHRESAVQVSIAHVPRRKPQATQEEKHFCSWPLQRRYKGDVISNAVFYSLPGVDICSRYYIWTIHHRPGKVIFILYLSFISTQNVRVELAVPCSTHLNACPTVEGSLVQFPIVIVKGIWRNPYLNVILYWVSTCDLTGKQPSWSPSIIITFLTEFLFLVHNKGVQKTSPETTTT